MKSILLATSILVFAHLTVAQTENKDLAPQDPKAQELLDALSSKAESYKSFSANFEYTLINNAEGINETQKGSVVMKGKEKYKLDVAGQEIMSDGETVWTYIKDVGELQISDVPEEDENDGNIMNPANAFHMYKNGFKYQYDGKTPIDGIEAEVIKMYPMNPKGKNFHTLIVNIDKTKLELVSMIVKGKDGNEYTYRLKNFTPNIDVSDSDFEFDEDSAEDIIDLRE